jgi:hypothetical protein
MNGVTRIGSRLSASIIVLTATVSAYSAYSFAIIIQLSSFQRPSFRYC